MNLNDGPFASFSHLDGSLQNMKQLDTIHGTKLTQFKKVVLEKLQCKSNKLISLFVLQHSCTQKVRNNKVNVRDYIKGKPIRLNR